MTDGESGDTTEAVVRRDHNLSAIWFLPLLALAIGLWMLYQQWRDQGPLVTITFDTATGLEAGKTLLKTRDVEVGVVESISLSEDLETVRVEARVRQNADRLLREDTRFWIVTPQIGLSGVSGLNTLVSGVYIELAPGNSRKESHQFKGLHEPPVTPSNTPGMHIILRNRGQTAYSVGDPIVYKGISVGKIEEVNFNLDERVVYYKTFVEAPYHQLVTDNTRFWNASGIQIDLGTEGISVQTESLKSLLTNGVTFGVPVGLAHGEMVSANREFHIYPDLETASAPHYAHAVEYVLLIEDSVRGLNVGAPVEYRGIAVGEVADINFVQREDRHLLREDYRIPVLISLEPGKAGYPDTSEGEDLIREQIDAWIKDGLQARLQSGSLLTGRLLVDLQHYADQQLQEVSYFEDRPVIPTRRGEFSELTSKVEALLDKFHALPIENTMRDFSSMAREFESTAAAARQLSDSLNQFVSSAEDEKLLENLSGALDAFAELSKSFTTGSRSRGEAVTLLELLNARLQELRPLLLHLNQRPNSLIFGAPKERDLEPKASAE